VLLAILTLFSACKSKDSKTKFGKINFVFSHSVEFDTMKYVNAAGNPYLVSEIQYFISDITLHKKNGEELLLDADESIHYIDTDLPETFFYNLKDSIPEGNYESISFTFGINEEKNKSGLFVNPPESFMFWPKHLGGGYHYMKLNGKWETPEDEIKVFNFHLGIGQKKNEEGEITGFIQNYFEVKLPNSSFSVSNGQTIVCDLEMNVDRWFTNPHDYDFNYWGGQIMQNEEAMRTACDNGHDVFSVNNIGVIVPEINQ